MSSTTSHSSMTSINGHDPNYLFFRVSDKTSASPRLANGFNATAHPFNQIISQTTWMRDHNHLYFSGDFRRSDDTQREMMEHVLGGWPRTARRYQKASDWISASMSFDWAVWEITRRLVRLQRDEVSLSLITRRWGYSRNYRGSRNIVEDAQNAMQDYGLEYLNKDQEEALRYSLSSSEVLFYGRIFNKDLVEDTDWTYYDPGYEPTASFMQGFFKPKKRWTGRWLDNLVFDPLQPFYTAQAKIRERRDQIETSRRPAKVVSRRNPSDSDSEYWAL